MNTRLAIVGLGDAGYSMHLPAAAMLNDVTVVGICDNDEARLARSSAKFGVKAYRDAEEMFVREKPDCVVIATPSDTHARLCLAALSHKCHVICEKPFTTSAVEASELISAAIRADRRIAVNHEFREMPIFGAVLDAVAAEGREAIVFAQAWQQVDLPPAADAGWRRAMPRRVLHEAGVHLIDFMMAVFDGPPLAVFASMYGGANQEEPDAVVSLAMHFPAGRIANIAINRLAKGENHYFDARVDTVGASYRASFGGRARLTAGLHRAKQPHMRLDYGVSGMAWKEVGSRRSVIARNPADPRMSSTRDVLSRTLAAFRSGGPVPCSAEWARDVCRVIEAAYRSAESGRLEAVEAAS